MRHRITKAATVKEAPNPAQETRQKDCRRRQVRGEGEANSVEPRGQQKRDG